MTWAWVVPTGVALVGLPVLAALARRAADEAAGLRSTVRALAAIEPEIGELRMGAGDASAGVRRLRQRPGTPVR